MAAGITRFAQLQEFRDRLRDLPKGNAAVVRQAKERNARLTKPSGSLGRLEELAVWYAAWRGHTWPDRIDPQILIFAGNHGVAKRGVSAFPPEVTRQMVANFEVGGAAINQLAVQAGARLDVCPIELDRPTGDITQGPAMSEAEFLAAIERGWNAVSRRTGLLVVGEMGIGNTTAASAICFALYGGDADGWIGKGTGVTGDTLRTKQEAVAAAVALNGPFDRTAGLRALQHLGGREIAAMAGAIMRARCYEIPVILDGFVCSAAAAALQAEAGDALDHAIAGHRSDEAAHGRLLERLGKLPLLDLEMRLGEGSGAAAAILILKCALACHSGMSTFDEAGVSRN
ncbi:MAG: nicotinate-nucleotide--dimethylbenzimidazole phosphoribosyltransferase [Rhodobacteraceae bacterium]|nr:nicotinate-nucleotide--dimethylbenzimidazole phosphoribosyltransferase [Paracoccaceae bacterium]